MTYTAVRTTTFTGTAEADVEPTVTWLDPYPNTSGGYYAFNSTGTRLKLQFSQDGNRGLFDLTGTYTDDQYAKVTIQNLSSIDTPTYWLGLCLQGKTVSTSGTETFYLLQISQDTNTVPLTTKIIKVTNRTTYTTLATINNVTWANGNIVLFRIVDGVLTAYRDTGSGFGAAIITYDDSASPISGGKPGLIIRKDDWAELDDLEFGDWTPDPIPVFFTGTVPSFAGVVSTAFSQSIASYFDGTETPFSYAVQSGTLPTGLTLNSSTGVISGTPSSAGTWSGIVIRATDVDTNTADTNSFSIVIYASATPTISNVSATRTTATITYTGPGDEYRINAGAWASVGPSPAIISGLSAATEYDLEIRYSGNTPSDVYVFGTTNRFSGDVLIENAPASSSTMNQNKINVGIKVGI